VRLLQEDRRAEDAAALAPVVAAAQQQLLGAGEGDVGQPPLLARVAGGVGLQVALERALVEPVERRQLGAVAAQREREQPGVGGPAGGGGRLGGEARRAGAGAAGQPGHGDHRPLQALGGVHRHELHGVGAAGGGEVEPVLLVLGGRQVREERRQHRLARAVLGGVAGEGGGRRRRRRPGRRGRRPGRPTGRTPRRRAAGCARRPPPVGQRLVGPAAQRPQLVAQPLEPAAALGRQRVLRPTGGRSSSASTSEPTLRVVHAEHHRLHRSSGRPAAATHERPRAPAEHRQVARTDPPPGSGEQPQQRCVGGRVVEHGEGGPQVGHLGNGQQPPSPTTSTGTPRCSKAVRSRANIDRLRQSTAARAQCRVGSGGSASTAACTCSATQAASASTSGSSATRTSPSPSRSGAGRSRGTGTPSLRRSSDTRLARRRIRPPLR
jgi:hypothetical protein